MVNTEQHVVKTPRTPVELTAPEQMSAHYLRVLDQQCALCDELEAVADCLPHASDAQSI
jgi:hypothetical protein